MKRKLLLVAAALVVVGVALVALTWANLGRIVKFGIEEGGSLVLGVPVRLKDATVSVKTGTVSLDGLTIGNPKGFSAPDMFSLDHASATVEIGSLRSDVIVVKDVTIDGPRITLEFSGATTNWGTVMAKLRRPPTPEEQAKTGKKKMRIGHLQITGATVAIGGIPLASEAALPLPPVDMQDVGGSSAGSGESVRTVIIDVIAALYTAITDAAGGVVPEQQFQKLGAEALSQVGKEGGKAEGAAGKATELLKGLIEKKSKDK